MTELQKRIIKKLNAKPTINWRTEVEERIKFLKKYLLKTGKKGYVLSISGGQDSLLAGKLAQLAIEQLRYETNKEYKFFAVRLPYGVQSDEEDAQLALEFINPDKIININIKQAVDVSVQNFESGTKEKITDYLKGNIKARERMKVHYDIAGYFDLVVIGTDHAAEALTGFFTKYGDGGTDIVPLAGLNKRQGRNILEHLEAPKRIYLKEPTADLLDNIQCQADENVLGLKYEEIDNYLEGKSLPKEIIDKIENRYLQSEHKRKLPVTPWDKWWFKNE
ncbi:ammonia-dependent NAD(+) synthetase [Clostridiaceae bacterium M8S5]|nr:ammonia-dependent NAD(+) synthetase [Clostridiaceae bacterium M8S5]